MSLFEVMKNFKALKQSVIINKIKLSTKMKKYLIYPKKHQPNLCTFVDRQIKRNNKVILYKPRVKSRGTVISHLGELYLGSKAKGSIINKLKFI